MAKLTEKQNIKEAAMDYMHSHECNFYAEDNNTTLYFDGLAVDVESIWYSDKEEKIYLHVGCKEFEGDIDIDSLSEDNQQRMLEAFGIDTKREKMWEQVTRYVTLANEHLDGEDIKAQIHIERLGGKSNYEVYVLYDGNDVDVKEGDVRLENAIEVIDKVWNSLVGCYAKQSEREDDYITVKLRRVSGNTHEGEANLIYSFTDFPLCFIHKRGVIENVGGDIDRFINEAGCFAVNAEDYHEAMRQVYLHENGYLN